jgi:hypothetical protein
MIVRVEVRYVPNEPVYPLVLRAQLYCDLPRIVADALTEAGGMKHNEYEVSVEMAEVGRERRNVPPLRIIVFVPTTQRLEFCRQEIVGGIVARVQGYIPLVMRETECVYVQLTFENCEQSVISV